MRVLVRRILSALRVAFRLGFSQFRKIWFSLSLQGVSFGSGVNIGKDVHLAATDGATLSLGANVSLADRCRIVCKAGRLIIGPRSLVGIGSIITARELIEIGSDCKIAENVSIRDQDHVFGEGVPLSKAGYNTAPIVIGDNVWLGSGTVVLKGVTIGNNAVVGAGAVVTADVAPGSVVVGVPARQISNIKK